MAKPKDVLSDAQQRAIKWIKSGTAKELGSLGAAIGQLLAELTSELADAKLEAVHWKQAFDVTAAEMKVAVAAMIAKAGESRLVVTKADFGKAVGLELFTQQPDDDTRIYELRERQQPRTQIDRAVSRIIRPH